MTSSWTTTNSSWTTLPATAVAPMAWGTTYVVTTELLPPGRPLLAGALRALPAGALAAVFLSEPLRRRIVVAGALGVAGVSMIVLQPGAQLDAVGVTAGLAGAASMATGVTLTKRWRPPVSNLTYTAWQLLAGGLALVVATVGFVVLDQRLGVMQVAGIAVVLTALWSGSVRRSLAAAPVSDLDAVRNLDLRRVVF